jgi:hypothetical protein
MKQLSNKRLRVTLWLLLAIVLVVMTAGTLFAAGEQLERSAILSGGSTRSSNSFVMRDVVGLWAAGSDIAPSGAGLCSGFGCDVHSNVAPDDPDDPEDPDDPDDPDDPQLELFMPQVETNLTP